MDETAPINGSPENQVKTLPDSLKKLDQDSPGHKCLAEALQDIYQNSDKYNKETREKYSTNWRPAYQAKSATEVILKDVVDAVGEIEDPMNFFSILRETIDDCQTSSEFLQKLMERMKTKLGIPVILLGLDDINSKEVDSVDKNWVPLENGEYVYNWFNDDPDNQNNYGQTIEIDYKEGDKYLPTGKKTIILNKAKLDDPVLLQTIAHEIGHMTDTQLGRKNNEAYPALFGLKAVMMMAEKFPQEAKKAILNPLLLYNWVVFGTVAPQQ